MVSDFCWVDLSLNGTCSDELLHDILSFAEPVSVNGGVKDSCSELALLFYLFFNNLEVCKHIKKLQTREKNPLSTGIDST